MKKIILLFMFLPLTSLANFPVKMSQTWEISENKIYVRQSEEVLWVLDHSCEKTINPSSKVSIHVNQTRVRRNTPIQLVVNGRPQQCQVEQVRYLQ